MKGAQDERCLRASLLRELIRLRACRYQGGPCIETRDGVLYARAASGSMVKVDADLIAVLTRLPEGAGPDVVAEVLA
jgi:hypothetical protein